MRICSSGYLAQGPKSGGTVASVVRLLSVLELSLDTGLVLDLIYPHVRRRCPPDATMDDYFQFRDE